MKDKEENVCGVSIECQIEGSKIESEISQVYNDIARELVKIWDLWRSGFGYYWDISADETDRRITFMQSGCMGDCPSKPYHLFGDKRKWININVYLTRQDIADPNSFLSKHKKYRQEYDENLRKLKEETERKEKEKRKKDFDELKKEFGTKKNENNS
ncbi:hypothetical protein KAW18_02970 [candidate division WOR-3 bacterium]|nr:hypothetical protein [candidate division WOR-3 bacterium]